MELENEQWNNVNKENICGIPVAEITKVVNCVDHINNEDNKDNGLTTEEECVKSGEKFETEIVIKDLTDKEAVDLDSVTEEIIDNLEDDKEHRVSESVKEKLDEKDHEHDSGTDLGPEDHILDETESSKSSVVKDATVKVVDSDLGDIPDTSVCCSDLTEDSPSSGSENYSENGLGMGNTVEGENKDDNATSRINADEFKTDRLNAYDTQVDNVTNNNIECDTGKQIIENEATANDFKEESSENYSSSNKTAECLEVTNNCEESVNDDLQIQKKNDELVDHSVENETKVDLSLKTSTLEGAKRVEDVEIVIDQEKVQQFIQGVLNDIQNMVNDGEIVLDNDKDKEKDLHDTENANEENIEVIATDIKSEEEVKANMNRKPEDKDDTPPEQCGENANTLEDTIEKTHPGDQKCDMSLDQSLKSKDSQGSDFAKALAEGNLQISKMVEEEMKVARQALRRTQESLQNERANHNREVIELKIRLYHSQVALKQQRAKSESQMSDVMSHLMLLEGRLRKEQTKVREKLLTKDRVISDLEVKVVKLKEQNEQLLNLLKEICAKGGMNGYMREGKKKNGEKGDSKDKKGKDSGKLGSVKDKFLAKNRSSLELSSFSLEDLLSSGRLCSSQEDLRGLGSERKRSDPKLVPIRNDRSPKENFSPNENVSLVDHGRFTSISSKSLSDRFHKPSQNVFVDGELSMQSMNKSTSESSQLSEVSNSSGIYSNSDLDISGHEASYSDHSYNDDDDDRIFSFNSTHISTPIAEEDSQGSPKIHIRGHMMSMGSMPNMAYQRDQHLQSGKNRPHSLSSVDLDMIEKHEQRLARQQPEELYDEIATPPSSPSYNQPKNELTPFQTFKTMFKRKGSKNKGKKRSVSLSQTSSTEYSEALKKHFEKYDMQ